MRAIRRMCSSSKTVAAVLRCSPSTLRRRIRAGVFTVPTLPGVVRFRSGRLDPTDNELQVSFDDGRNQCHV